MGGKVLKLESERLLELGEKRGHAKGKAEGKAEGIAVGELRAFIKLVDSGELTKEKAAEMLGISVDAFDKRTAELKNEVFTA